MALLNIFDIAGSALTAQSKRLNVAASNLANADSVTGPDGQPYRAKQVVFQVDAAPGAATGGVKVADVVESQAPDSLEAAPDKETAAVQESATAGQTEPETTPAAQAAGAETTQAEETGTASMGLETVLIAIAAGFFGGMVISRLRKNKKR